MISDRIIKKIIKDSDNINDENVRNSYGYLAGVVGIIANLILFITKASIGLITSSISILADSINNLSDMASSIITIVGFKLSSMPPDREHPFGHGRLEYVSALIVAFMVMMVGFEFIKTSFQRVLNPVRVEFELSVFILLLISIFIKLWLSFFNKYIGNKINSSAIKASGVDALGDVFTSSTVAVAFFASRYTDFPIDGVVGVVVSIAILYAGYSLVKETISPLLGEAPDKEFVDEITKEILSYPNIQGVHDLIIHNYGVGKKLASVHVEIPAEINIMLIHDIIDQIEREIEDKYKLHLVIHMDPVCIACEEVREIKDEVDKIIKYNPIIKSMHDFRILGNAQYKTLVFDVVVDNDKMIKIMTEEELTNELENSIKNIHKDYKCIIKIDKDFY